MLAYNGKNLTYDLNGNLSTRSDVCGTTTFTWDARNRLTGISGYKPDCTALTASFGYDALDRRISKTINGTATQFVYDRWDIIQEIKGGVKTNYVRSLYIDEPLTRITGSTIRHYVTDALGSVMALADDTGATKTMYVYDAFGNATVSGEASDNPFQYTARENDGTGLYYYRARYYSPEMQRFVSEDPIRLMGGGVNYYSMTGNSPVNYRDPLGLWRMPDFASANINIAIPNPVTGTIVGWSGTASIDRYGNWYWSPLGGGIGKSATFVSGSATANWMNQPCKPSEKQLSNFLSDNGFNVTGGYWAGVSESWSPGNGSATGVGFVTPQAGGSYNYSFQGSGNTGLSW